MSAPACDMSGEYYVTSRIHLLDTNLWMSIHGSRLREETELIACALGVVLLTVGRSYVGNDVAH